MTQAYRNWTTCTFTSPTYPSRSMGWVCHLKKIHITVQDIFLAPTLYCSRNPNIIYFFFRFFVGVPLENFTFVTWHNALGQVTCCSYSNISAHTTVTTFRVNVRWKSLKCQSCGQIERGMGHNSIQQDGEMWLRRITGEVLPDYLVSICLPSVSPIFLVFFSCSIVSSSCLSSIFPYLSASLPYIQSLLLFHDQFKWSNKIILKWFHCNPNVVQIRCNYCENSDSYCCDRADISSVIWCQVVW
jgi:hypothetical protein